MAIKKTMEVLKDRYKDRNGGYTRIIKLGARVGDGAEIVQIELV
jgi:large subunit ribosomal protein L17